MKNYFHLWSAKEEYSKKNEIAYYKKSKEDRRALPYENLTKYMQGSVGCDIFNGKTVLDMGCGEGIYTAWIADKGGATKAIGLELTEHRIRKEYEEHLHNIQFVNGDIFSPPFQLHEFDIVFMNLVLHHLRFDLNRAIMNISNCLKKNGTFIAFEPNIYSPASVLAHYFHAKSANEGFLSPHRIKKSLAAFGFADIRHGFFWRDRSWAQNPILATSFWITARKAL